MKAADRLFCLRPFLRMTDTLGGFSLIFLLKSQAVLLRSTAQPSVSSGGKIKELSVLELCVPVRTGMVLDLLWLFPLTVRPLCASGRALLAGGRSSWSAAAAGHLLCWLPPNLSRVMVTLIVSLLARPQLGKGHKLLHQRSNVMMSLAAVYNKSLSHSAALSL